MSRRVYIYAERGWWSFSPKEWEAHVLAYVQAGGELALPPDKTIARAPEGVRFDEGRPYATTNAIKLIQPLDWDVRDWMDEVEEVTGWAIERRSFYDEEGIEGWLFESPDGQESADINGDWGVFPELPEALLHGR
jgi:hypothetical protein